MPRRCSFLPLGLALVALSLTACSGDGAVDVSATAPLGSAGRPAAPSPATSHPGAAPTSGPHAVPPTPSATPAVPAAPTPSGSRKPAFAFDVAAAQRVLVAGGYYAGAVDGRRGPALRSAVMAFQKVNGIGADGTVGPVTVKALASPRTPVLKGSSPGNRVEVDLTRQVLYVVKGGRIARIMPVSSGNGATYAQKSGGTARALTPVGYYRIQRRIVGERKADLGTLYDPQYFYGGWAIHGSNSVPAGPASHGCVRVTRPDAKALLDLLSNGMTVYLYGGRYTFTAGSSAPGTDNPTGDTPADAAPQPTNDQPGPQPTAAPSRRPAGPSPTPTKAAPQPAPKPAAPKPATPKTAPKPAASPLPVAPRR